MKRPWWSNAQWSVEAIAVRDSPHVDKKVGEWIQVYEARLKSEAERLAAEWGAKMNTPTRVVPGIGHPSRRAEREGRLPMGDANAPASKATIEQDVARVSGVGRGGRSRKR